MKIIIFAVLLTTVCGYPYESLKGRTYGHQESVERHHEEDEVSSERKSSYHDREYEVKSIAKPYDEKESERYVPSYQPSKSSVQYAEETEPVYRRNYEHRVEADYPDHDRGYDKESEGEIHHPETLSKRMSNVPLQTPYLPERLRLLLDSVNQPSLAPTHPPMYKPPKSYHEESSYNRRESSHYEKPSHSHVETGPYEH